MLGLPIALAKPICLCAVGPSTSSIDLGRAISHVAGTALARAPCARSEGSLRGGLRSVATFASLTASGSDGVASSSSTGPGSSSSGFGVGVSGRRYRPAGGVGLSFSGGAPPSVREGSRSPDRDPSRASLPAAGSRSGSVGRSAEPRTSARFASAGSPSGARGASASPSGHVSMSTSSSSSSSSSAGSSSRGPAASAAAPAAATSTAGSDEGLVRSFRSPRSGPGGRGSGSGGGGRGSGAAAPSGSGRASYEREERRGGESSGRDSGSARGSGGGSGRPERDGEQRRFGSGPRPEGRGSGRGGGRGDTSAQRRPGSAPSSAASRPSGRDAERPRAADPTALAAATAAAGVAAAVTKAAQPAATAAAPKQPASAAAAYAPAPVSIPANLIAPAAELVAIPDGQYPTFVPRNPGISDGEWNARDKEMVTAAQQDAAEAVKPARLDQHGTVILGRDAAELEELAARYGQPRFRAKQLLEGVLQGARSVEDITTIPKEWRAQLLADGVRTGRSLIHHSVGDADGTRKFLLQLDDGRIVETVGIPTEDRLTVCVSSQVGCPMRCTFCATGKGGFARNLAPHEIMDQVLTVQELYGRRVSNVVFMGMGEPLLNLPSVTRAYHGLNKQIGIGGAFITISTVGVPNAIRRLAAADTKATLAVSLHSPNQALRESIIPSAKAYPIEALLEDCAAYFKRTGRRVTFEYTLLSGVNDEVAHAQELVALLQRYNLLSHVNVIPWNPVDESEFTRPSRNRVFAFTRAVEAAGLTCTIRETRGLEAAAACGQLRNQFQKTPLPQFEKPL
ncbi:hypothetical protein HXX76_014396 [Chlamydomonas incerta]|uniref:Radical SAM core domain-containing protein n=1 Tax=Chlamydomonas incerta TaxID=51695 RepID=A0A835SPN1_CHLIN|nr:hypothetical protein HXX76_014396 [Chlamydomonas incerta]|eukprot:KAG2424515.1 hypothetical protein HXX76_014396 [Chlamydomonas incerta]